MAVFLINICKFNGCGITFPSLGDLIQHIEDTHIEDDQQLIEQKEQSQPSCLPLSCVLRFITDAARKEGPFLGSTGADLKRKLAIKHHTYSMSSSNRSNTPTGSELDDEEMMMVSESEDSNDSWTTEEFSSDFIMKYGSRHSGSLGNNSFNEKPFACPVPGCKKRYKNVNGIKYHSKNGHKKDGKVRKGYKCHCGKSYKTSQGLKNHSTSVHSSSGNGGVTPLAAATISNNTNSSSQLSDALCLNSNNNNNNNNNNTSMSAGSLSPSSASNISVNSSNSSSNSSSIILTNLNQSNGGQLSPNSNQSLSSLSSAGSQSITNSICRTNNMNSTLISANGSNNSNIIKNNFGLLTLKTTAKSNMTGGGGGQSPVTSTVATSPTNMNNILNNNNNKFLKLIPQTDTIDLLGTIMTTSTTGQAVVTTPATTTTTNGTQYLIGTQQPNGSFTNGIVSHTNENVNSIKMTIPSLVNLGILTPATSPKQQHQQQQQQNVSYQSINNQTTMISNNSNNINNNNNTNSSSNSNNSNNDHLPLTPISPNMKKSVNFLQQQFTVTGGNSVVVGIQQEQISEHLTDGT